MMWFLLLTKLFDWFWWVLGIFVLAIALAVGIGYLLDRPRKR